MQEIHITIETAGGRLDKMLFRYLDKAGTGFIYKMLRKKNILLNGKKASGRELLQEGDCIRIYMADQTMIRFQSGLSEPQKDTSGLLLPRFHSWIVYEDDNLLAINKPPGILSQKSVPEDVSLNDMIQAYLGHGPAFTPGIANRLDRNTSGLVLAGKNPAAQRSLSQAIRDRGLHKYYLCIVDGKMDSDLHLEGYLLKNKDSNQVRIMKETWKSSAPAQFIRTEVKVLDCSIRCSLLQIDLITGRSHQIRAHLSSEGHPVIGDPKYGIRSVNRMYRDQYHVKHQLLHAWQVNFNQMSGILSGLNGTSIEASPPPPFIAVSEGEDLHLPLQKQSLS